MAAEKSTRSNPPFRVLYGNDVTHITSCVEPARKTGEPFNDERLRTSIAEAAGADAHLLQPGLGWIPWWKSASYSGAEHYLRLEREQGVKLNAFGRYLVAGGDMIRTLVDECRKRRVAPFVSFRLNDGHHVGGLAEALTRGQPTAAMSRFFWENYERFRLGSDPADWSQAVFNWAIPEVREHKFAFLREIAEGYEVDGLELDFLRHYSYFRLEETPLAERRTIMTAFVRRVRELLDRTARGGRRRWLCVRVPGLLAAHDRLGIDLAAFVGAGVDMINLSSSYFTVQDSDLPKIHESLPGAFLYLEMTHTNLTGRALGGSGTQPFQRTTDEQFYTTAHLARTEGATGVSLFNFPYFRYHVMPELGPFNEPPFHILPHLADDTWLARQPQWYFLAAVRNEPPAPDRPLPVMLDRKQPRQFTLRMAPTVHQTRDGWLRIMAEKAIPAATLSVELNGTALEAAAYIRKPIEHPYEGLLGEPEQYVCFHCPRSLARVGENLVTVRLSQENPLKLIYLDIVLP